jgi:hypothetical protein
MKVAVDLLVQEFVLSGDMDEACRWGWVGLGVVRVVSVFCCCAILCRVCFFLSTCHFPLRVLTSLSVLCCFVLCCAAANVPRCIRELNSAYFHHEVVKRGISQVLDKSEQAQEQLSALFAHLR